MTNEEAIKMIADDMRLHHDYLSGNYRKALNMAIEALRNSAELISWLDECISDEHTTPIERATLMAVKCKVEGIVYVGNI